MKTKVKRLSKRTLAVFLGVLMLVTSIGFGTLITAQAYSFGDTLYLITGTGNAKSAQTTNSGALKYISSSSKYATEVTTTNTDIYFHFSTSTSNENNIFTSADGGLSLINDGSGNYAKLNSNTGTITTFNIQSNNGHYSLQVRSTSTFYILFYKWKIEVTTTKPDGYDEASGGGGTTPDPDPTPSGSATEVTDSALLKILDGTDVSFYIESYTDKEWTDLCNSDKATPAYTRYGKIGTRWGKSYVQIAKTDRTSYDRITNNKNDWNGDENTAIKTAKGGEHFVTSGGSNVGSVGSTTTINSTYQNTDTMTISTTSNGTKTAFTENSNKVFDMKLKYYIKSGDKYYYLGSDYDISAKTTAQTKNYSLLGFSPGSYSLITLAVDSEDYVRYVADTDIFTVTAISYDVTVKSNSSRLGSGTASPSSAYAGQTVTININENMGAISGVTATDASSNSIAVSGSGTTRTFTMPASDVTVNLTFEEYSAESDFYYNGYETSGEETSTFYAKRMTEGKLNGKTFSYYHVSGRTGTDQLFTISKKNPAHNSLIFFRTPESWTDKHGWDSGVQAQFFSSDDVQLKDWAWMTFDKNYGNGDKVYKISVPYGARKVQFRTQKNDPSTYNWPYTAICDLKDANNKNDCFYIKSYNSSGDQNDIGTCNIGNQDYVIPDQYFEYFNGTGIYTDHWSTSGFDNHNANHTGSHSYTKPKGLGTNAGDYYVLVLYSGTTYTINGVEHKADKDPEVIWLPKLPGTEQSTDSEVNVYGKDGSIVIDWDNKTASGASGSSGTAYGYSIIADTKLYDGSTAIGTDVDDDGASYEKATVVVNEDEGKDIKIQTTIASSYRSKYYLKGWCIDGVTYACGNNVKGVNASNAGTNGVYEMTYTVPAGTENNANIEITPIYYLKDNSNCITFYLEGYSDVVSKWGNTPYIYPFYGDLNNVDNSFGVYPGQPMVYADGQYSVEIPIVNNPIIKATSNTKVKGITISNGYADHVHRNIIYKWSDADNDAAHKQTYDYDDFYKIYEECLKNGTEHPNAIFFRIQDEEKVFNRATYGGGKSGQFASGTSNINISTIASSGNGWELLTNRYGHAVNIFGETSTVSEPGSGVTATNDTNAIYVVSTGYNANIAGDYGTMWKIYNRNGQLISKDTTNSRYGIPPSLLVVRGNTSGYTTSISYPSANHSVDGVGTYTDSNSKYVEIYKSLKSTYNAKRVYITYEKDAQDTRSDSSGTGAYRLDGRWYYTHKTDSVQSTMSIQYWDEATAKWLDDDSSSGTPTQAGCNANFTDSGNNGKTSGSHVIENNEKYTFTASTNSGWKFDSWQIKYSSSSYEPISTEKTSSMPATASYEIVARFVPAVTGSLTINHTLDNASTGEGTVDMAVNVYTNSSMTTKVTGFTEKTGSRVYLNDDYINNTDAAGYYVKVELRTTPKYDGKVSAFGYDTFNTSKSITATTSPANLPGSENTLTTSTFSFPVSALYNVANQTTKELNYTSLIDATPHYYNFIYNFTARDKVPRTYTSKGEISQKDYKTYITNNSNHTLDNSILAAKAPFESNFLKTNTLSKGAITYTSGTHTFSATSTFTQDDDVPTYHVIFKLPYNYYTESSGGTSYKKYNASGTTYNSSKATFDLAAKYNTFATIEATSTAPDTIQNKVAKVTDASDVNHTGNNFLTAPDTLTNGTKTMYFNYWEVRKGDTKQGDVVTKIYYPDFNYRVYSNYYVEAIYSENASDSWKLKYSDTDDDSCSIMYLGDSRNQWNNGEGKTSDKQTDASDLIYNDFIFKYNNSGKELKGSSVVKIGMILERVPKSIEAGSGYATGSASVSDMSSYKTTYSGTVVSRKADILSGLSSGSMPKGCVKVDWSTSDLNNKNFMEQSYSAYSQYGQTVEANSISFKYDSTMDNYVYRAYAYMQYDSDGNGTADEYVLSDPEYFCMKYTSSLKYSE